MINNVYYQPKVWQSSTNPIVWSFESTQWNQYDFQYVIDVYINGNPTFSRRLKQRPNPQGVGMIDLQPIVNGYIDLTEWANEYGSTTPYKDSSKSSADVFIKVGEEYRIGNGPLTIYNGLGVVGTPSFTIGATGYGGTANGMPVRVIPASLDFWSNNDHMTSTEMTGYWNPYVMKGDGKFLTKNPSTNILVRPQDNYTLTFLNWNDYGSGPWNGPILGAVMQAYSATGSAVSSANYYNAVLSGGGPQLNSGYTTATQSYQYNVLQFKCGPNDVFGTFSIANVAYYDIWLEMKTQSQVSSVGTTASQVMRFTIDRTEDCLYPTIRLSWLNELGGRDYWNFNMFYEKSISTSETAWSQTNLNWSAKTPVAMSGDKTGNWIRGGDKIINKNITTKIKIQSDWLDEATVDFLGDITTSPSVWCYIDNLPYTAIVTNSEYTYKFVKQTKLVQASYDLTLTKIQLRQNI